jgi:GAF domain-containing protein
MIAMAGTDSVPHVALAMDLDRVEALSDDLERVAEDKDAAGLIRALVGMFKARVPHYHWVGIYLLEGRELRLGPYAGAPSPHVRIAVGEGICGAAAEAGESIIVPDVAADQRYLACSLATRSEIVVPILDEGRVLGEIDIDSDIPNAFNEHDQALLERAASLIAGALSRATPPPRWEAPEAIAV